MAAHDARRRVDVVLEVAHVVGRDAQGRHAPAPNPPSAGYAACSPLAATSRARSAAPISPASLPSSGRHDARLRPVPAAGEVLRNVSRAGASSRSPAALTPPPMTKMPGSNAAARLAMPTPSQCPISPSSSRGGLVALAGRLGDQRPVRLAGSPPTRSSRSLAMGRVGVDQGPGLADEGVAAERTAPSSRGCRTRSGARRARPACGRTRPAIPKRPRCDLAVRRGCRRRCRCPGSPSSRGSRRARRRSVHSAHAAALASLSTKIGAESRCCRAACSGSSRQDRCGAKTTVARSAATNPAAPMPTAATSAPHERQQLLDDLDDGVLDHRRALGPVRGVSAGPVR